jgi:hypothetical protein
VIKLNRHQRGAQCQIFSECSQNQKRTSGSLYCIIRININFDQNHDLFQTAYLWTVSITATPTPFDWVPPPSDRSTTFGSHLETATSLHSPSHTVEASMIKTLARLWISVVVVGANAVEAYFATTPTTLLAQARGIIPNAYGSVKAGVSSGMALTLQFSIVAGKGYKAGAVTATTDRAGRLVRLAKQKQACTVTYNPNGSVRSVKCSGSRRLLSDAAIKRGNVTDEDSPGTGREQDNGEKHKRVARRLQASSSCASCATLVFSTFTGKIKSVCHAQVSRLIPPKYQWAKIVAAGLCGMPTKLGDPVAVAYRTCRCCIENSDCPSQVCSDGVCLSQKIRSGEPCPDFEDEDCENGRCALGSYPTGKYVCCPSNAYIPVLNNVTYNYYCAQTQAVGASCSQDKMCKTFGCGRKSYPSGDYICCNSSGTGYSSATKSFHCLQVAGRPCGANEMCSSGVCSEGVCIPGKLGTGQPCPDGENDDCWNGACGRSSYPSGGYICCDDRSTVYSASRNDSYCRGIPLANDSPCGANAMCSSGVCYEGVCIPGKLGTGQPCPGGEDDDCLNRACGRSSYPSGGYVCCSSGSKVYSWSKASYYCRGDPSAIGSLCGANDMCSSGVCYEGVCIPGKIGPGQPCPEGAEDCMNGVCAQSSFPSGVYVCCTSNRSYEYWSPITQESTYFCPGIQSTGKSCPYNEICASGVCSGGVCMAGRLGAGQACPDKEHDDCASGACGVGPMDNHVCCATNNTWTWRRTQFCTNLEVGSRCFKSDMCASGVCSRRVCVAKRLYARQRCEERNEADCYSGKCARGSFLSGDFVCCDRDKISWNGSTYCIGQDVGSPCFSNSSCSSGVCSNGVCLAKPDGKPCQDGGNGVCLSNRCGRSSYPSGDYVCCSQVFQDEDDWYCVGVLRTGSSCTFDLMCSSLVCSGGVCIPGKLSAGQACPDGEDSDCLNRRCGRSSYPNGGFVCCASNDYLSKPGEEVPYCTMSQAVGLPCFTDRLCASGVCSGGACLAQKIGAGQLCPDRENVDCASGVCSGGVCLAQKIGAGQLCPDHENVDCASGVCSGGVCLAQKIGAGQLCADRENDDCATGVCSGGVCMAQKINIGQRCPDGEDDDCQNGVCARLSYPAGEHVCCPSGRQYYDANTSDFFCSNSCLGSWPDPGTFSAQSCNGQVCYTGGVNRTGRTYNDTSTIVLADALPGLSSYECRYAVTKTISSGGGCATIVPKYNDATVVALSRYRRLSPCHIQSSWIVSSAYDRTQYGYPYVRLTWDRDYESSYTDGWYESPESACGGSETMVREFHSYLCFYGNSDCAPDVLSYISYNNCYYMNGYNKSDPRTACAVCDYTICW